MGLAAKWGAGIEKNLPEAVRWFTLSAIQGFAPGQAGLADLFADGQGVAQDYGEAIRLYKLAAAQDNPYSEYQLGELEYSGRGVVQNYAEALSWFQLAAHGGYADAQFTVGLMNAMGQGAERNFSEAARWYLLAAQQGNAAAAAQLGLLYDKGRGVPQDFAQSLRWYRLRAQQGNTYAAAFLGESYAQGDGTPRDPLRAYMWLNLVAPTLAGDLQNSVMSERDQIASTLTSAQLDAAQAMGRECEASNFKACGINGTAEGSSAHPSRNNPSTERLARYAPEKKAPNRAEMVATGSGFFVSGVGHIVTAAHVVDTCAIVRSSQGGPLKRIAIDAQSDLALFMSTSKPAIFAHLHGGRGARLGESVVAVGYPLHGVLGADPIVTTGTLSSLAGLKNDRRDIQISAPVQPGNSGGPLLGENGSLVGVVEAKLDALRVAEITGDIPENVSFAVSASTLQSFLNTNSVPYAIDDRNVTRSAADIASEASRYTVLLECWK
jgi:S1-C subfamily serine protease